MASNASDRCAVCQWRSAGLFCGLSARAQDVLERGKTTRTFRRGQIVFLAGEQPKAIWVIRTGRIMVFRTSPSGQEEHVIRLLGPGEILGYRPLLAGGPYIACAEAVVNSNVCVIPAATFWELLGMAPDLASQLLARLARDSRLSEDLAADLLYGAVHKRVAHLLLLLCASIKGTEDSEVLRSQHLRRQDMARIVGTTPETFSRVLRSFAQRGIVSVSRSCIQIRDRALLHKVCEDEPSGRIDSRT